MKRYKKTKKKQKQRGRNKGDETKGNDKKN